MTEDNTTNNPAPVPKAQQQQQQQSSSDSKPEAPNTDQTQRHQPRQPHDADDANKNQRNHNKANHSNRGGRGRKKHGGNNNSRGQKQESGTDPLKERQQNDQEQPNNRNKDDRSDRNKKDRKNNHRKNKKNTVSFDPDYSPPDMRVRVATTKEEFKSLGLTENDVVYVPNYFGKPADRDVYKNLLDEVKAATEGSTKDVWTFWHGDSHLIADDHINWKNACPTFKGLIDRMQDLTGMETKASRFNWYKEKNEWKPYHFDAAAVDPKKAKTQNITVGLSLGEERELCFEHRDTRTRVRFPVPNGSILIFGKKVNVMWRHGVPPNLDAEGGRISIIAWGWLDQRPEVTPPKEVTDSVPHPKQGRSEPSGGNRGRSGGNRDQKHRDHQQHNKSANTDANSSAAAASIPDQQVPEVKVHSQAQQDNVTAVA
eukprot:Clim_evm11s245 gene=Clim_evmTU11s245